MLRKLILFIVILILGVLAIYGGSLQKVQAEESKANISVSQSPESSVAEGLEHRVKSSWPWYLTRASGIVAAVTLVILMLSGIGLVTGHTFSFLEPITAWASHRALGIAFGVAVLLHIFALYFDTFVPFNLVNLLVPFTSNYKPVTFYGVGLGSFYVALGVLCLYLVAAVVITSLLWVEKKPKLWKLTHLLSYLAMIFVFIHALQLGTDLASGFFRWLWVVVAVGVMFASLSRLWRAKTV